MNRIFDQALMAYNKETKKLDDLYRSAAKNCGMAECAFWILYTLRVEEKSFTQAEICEFLVEPKQTVNSALKKLVAEGYLALSAGTDQRSKLVRLTPKGEQLARERRDERERYDETGDERVAEREHHIGEELARKALDERDRDKDADGRERGGRDRAADLPRAGHGGLDR